MKIPSVEIEDITREHVELEGKLFISNIRSTLDGISVTLHDADKKICE